MLDFSHAIIMGIVEGLTEFLPVSSTAHLILTAQIFNIPQTDYIKSFEIIIQLGAILAVVALYFKKFFDFNFLKKLFVAFLPTGIIGLFFYKIIKNFLMGNASVILWSLAIGGLIMIIFEKYFSHPHENETWDVEKISYRQCLLLGFFQSIAMIPGVSRSAATIIGGRAIGIPKKTIVEFSFLLAVPTMLAATVLDVFKNSSSFTNAEINSLLVGFAVSFFTALLSIKLLLGYIKKHSFAAFGFYRIALVIILLLFL